MNISTAQRKIMKVLKPGGFIYPMSRRARNYRLMDVNRNPIKYVHGRTFKALLKKELITKQTDGSYASIGAHKISSSKQIKNETQNI